MRTKACRGIVVTVVAIWPAAAVAAVADQTSDHVALRAFDRYLRGRLSDVPAGAQSADAFVSSISASCPNVLAPIVLLPAGSVSISALSAFIEEGGADLGIAVNAGDHAPLVHLRNTLSKLRWSRGATRGIVKRYLAAERELFSLAPSGLCADARAFAANPAATPTGTLQWLATTGRVISHDDAATSAFVTVMKRFSVTADAQVIRDIAATAKRFPSAVRTALQPAVQKLLTALGLPA